MRGFILRALIGSSIVATSLVAAAPVPAAPPSDRFTVTPLVSDIPGAAPAFDANLVNGWGLARSPTSPWWVADNGAQKASLYNVSTTPTTVVGLAPTVEGGPTGEVFAGIAGNFLVATTASSTLAPAAFIFASEDGKIRAWRNGSAAALVTASGEEGAVFKGLAIAQPATGGPLLYATDFANGDVDVFNGTWQNVTQPGQFVDPHMKHHYAPFGIQTIGSRVFVTYAKQDPHSTDELHGRGRGFVDAYDLIGNFLGRVASHGQLNAPWGLAWAPGTFGRFAGDLLVGNFGDGQINAYEETDNGHFEHRGTLAAADGKKLEIDGLWALELGNAGSNGDPNTLFFTAGPNDEKHGLFGKITPTG
jgi:uncharacterized protein (TIGR03118 family)